MSYDITPVRLVCHCVQVREVMLINIAFTYNVYLSVCEYTGLPAWSPILT